MSALWLNLGSSARQFPKMVNLDSAKIDGALLCDIRLGLPFASSSTEIVVASHVLEHLHPLTELPGVLKEIHRVLQPGGLLRAAVPDMMVLTEAYKTGAWAELAKSQPAEFASWPAALKFSAIAFGNNSGNPFYDGHQVLFDRETLEWVFTNAGLVDVCRVAKGESRHLDLMKTYRDVGAAEEIIVEGVKP